MNESFKTSGLSKSDSNRIKGVAILMMLMHHMYLSESRFEGFTVSFDPFDQNTVINVASYLKICVSLFAFISGYGLFLSYRSHKDNTDKSASRQWVYSRLLKLITGFLFIYILSFAITACIDGRPAEIYFSGSKVAGCLYMLIDALGLANLFGTPTLCGTWWYMSAAILYIVFVPALTLLAERVGWLPIVVGVSAIPRLLGIDCPGTMNAWTFLIPVLCGMITADQRIFERMNKHGYTKLINNKYSTGTLSLPYAILSFVVIYVSFRVFLNFGYNEMWELGLGFFPVFVIVFLKYAIISIPVISYALDFLGRHSMTIFLTHTFIRVMYLSEVTYSNGHFLANYLVLLVLSVALAVIIDWLKKVLHINRIPAFVMTRIAKA